MQLSIILVSLSGMVMASPAAKIRSPHLVDGAGRLVPNEGEVAFGNPGLPEGAAGGNELGEGLHVPDNIEEIAHQVDAHEWGGQELAADILADLGAVSEARLYTQGLPRQY